MKNSVQRASQSITRPSNTDAYADGDVIAAGTAASLKFKVQQAADGAMLMIQNALLISSAYVATGLVADLWLFSEEPAAIDADNAAWTPTDADLANLIAIIPFASANWRAGDATAGAGGNAVCPATNLAIAVQRFPSDSTLAHGVLVARNAYVPVSAEIFTIHLSVVGG